MKKLHGFFVIRGGGVERQVVTCLGGLVSDERWKDVRLFCYRIDTSGGRFSTYEEEVGGLGIKIDEFGVDGLINPSLIRARRMEKFSYCPKE